MPWRKRQGGCHATSVAGDREAFDDEGISARLLIGCVSVVSDWCSLGLCDTAYLYAVFTIPIPIGTYLTTINVISNKKSGLFDEGTPAQ